MRGIPHKEQALVRRRCGNLGAVRELELWRLYERTSKPKPPQKAARLCLRPADHGIGAGPILLWDSKLFVVGFEAFLLWDSKLFVVRFEDGGVGLPPNPLRCLRITGNRLRGRNQQMPHEKCISYIDRDSTCRPLAHQVELRSLWSHADRELSPRFGRTSAGRASFSDVSASISSGAAARCQSTRTRRHKPG